MSHITNRVFLQRQQMILKLLGYYHGKCDGIWGPATIAAKRQFELSGKFNPGYPNNGMPFNDSGPYPSGIMRDWEQRGNIRHVDMTQEFIDKSKGELVTCEETFNPVPTSPVDSMTAKSEPVLATETDAGAGKVEQSPEVKQVEPAPVVEQVVNPEPEKVLEPAPVVTTTVEPVKDKPPVTDGNQNRHNNNRHFQHHKNKV